MDDFPVKVYDELRRIAGRLMRSERRDHTLQATALVHEAYARLIKGELSVEHRGHFLGLAASAMRRILIEHARARGREKRGGGAVKMTLDEQSAVTPSPVADVIDLDKALLRLAEQDPRMARVTELFYFGGLTWPEIAAVMDISEATVSRDLRMARAWLKVELS